jgi:hypothetical protein
LFPKINLSAMTKKMSASPAYGYLNWYAAILESVRLMWRYFNRVLILFYKYFWITKNLYICHCFRNSEFVDINYLSHMEFQFLNRFQTCFAIWSWGTMFLLSIVLSVFLQFINSDDTFVIFKLFLTGFQN